MAKNKNKNKNSEMRGAGMVREAPEMTSAQNTTATNQASPGSKKSSKSGKGSK